MASGGRSKAAKPTKPPLTPQQEMVRIACRTGIAPPGWRWHYFNANAKMLVKDDGIREEPPPDHPYAPHRHPGNRDHVIKPVANEGLEALRIRAEVETADAATTRRATWAPCIALDGELLALCKSLGLLRPDDKPVARLWAIFADPTYRGHVIRKTFGQPKLNAVRCLGFEMFAGLTRNGQLMTNARLSGQKLFCIADVKVKPSDSRERRSAMAHIVQLATKLMFEFVGDPDSYRQLGARLSGRCYICGRELTDNVSLERGIGPDCLKLLRKFDPHSLAHLRELMLAAHPDNGGSVEEYQAALARFTQAKRGILKQRSP